MALTWNGHATVEVATTTLTGATLPGMALQYNASAVLAPATTRIDALLLSEVVDATEANNRMYLFGAIDWSYFNRIGEPSSVVKGTKGQTVIGLLMAPGNAALNAGDTLDLDGTNPGMFKKGDGTADAAVCLDAMAAGAQYSGRVHMLV